MASGSDLSPRTRGGRWAGAVILAGLIVVVLLATGYFFVRSLELEEAKSLAESEAIARGVAAFIEAREERYRNNVRLLGIFPVGSPEGEWRAS